MLLPYPPSAPQSNTREYGLMDCLSPEQRLDAIADILGTIALRIIKERHEKHYEQDHI